MIIKLSLKHLFLVDALGAVLTALLLSQLLARFESYFGMPGKVLYILSGIAWVFAIYSFCCFFFVSGNRKPYLKLIAVANLLYGLLSLVLAGWYFQRLTLLGILYFFVEIVLVTALSLFEWQHAMSDRSL